MSKTKNVEDFLAWYEKAGRPKYIKVDWEGVENQAGIEYQNQWRAGKIVEETPTPSPFKTEKEFLDWFYKTKPSYIKVVGKSPRKVVRKSPRKVVRKSPRKVVRKSPRKVVRKSPRKVVRKSPRKVVRKSPRKVVRKSPVGCRIMTSKKYKERNGPPRPANETGCRNHLVYGNDGLLYESKVNKAGIYRWVKVKN
jgi:hypothetical protein